MADKSLPTPDLHLAPERRAQEERRALLRRAAIGLPVILATVHGRTAWARQNGSAACSGTPSAACAQTLLP
jgi:hypothetical protein